MAANKHTNKLKIQNYAYEISESGQLVQATPDGNYFEIPNESYFGNNGEYPLVEAMDIDWRPYEINGEPVVTTHDVLNNISQNIERLDYLDDAYTYTMDIIEENEEITAQALTNLDTRVLNIENVDLPDLDNRVETLETTYVSHEFLSNIGYVKVPMSYTQYGYAKLGRDTNVTIGGRVYPIGMESSTGRLGVEIPYQPGDNTITTITPTAEGSGNYVKAIKLSHVDNNPILSYTLTVSYATLPTLSATGTNSGLVINGISAGEHSITYSYTNVPSYEYIANNYETITYVRDAYTYIMDNIEENEYVTAQALTNLDTRVTNIEDDYVTYSYAGLNYVSYGYAGNNYVSYGYAGLNYASYGYTYAYVASAYADVMMSVDELENRIDNISNDYLNTVEGNGTSGYVIGRLGKNGHKVVYGYVAVPTYEYLRNQSYVYGTGYVTQQYLAEQSYVHGVGYVTQKYLADNGYINGLKNNNTGYVIGKISVDGQKISYAYVAVPTYEYLKTTGYLTQHQSLDNYVTKPNAIQNVHLGVNNASYVITLSYTIANDTSTTLTKTVDLPLESVVVNGYYNSGNVHLELKNGNYVKFSVSDLVNGLVSTTDLVNAGYLTSYTYTTAASGSSTTGGYKLDFSDKTYSKTGLSDSTGFDVTIPKAGTDYGVVKVGEGNNLVGINASGQLTYSQPNIPDIVISNDGTANGTNRVTNIYVDSSNKHKIHISYTNDTDSYINKFTTSATDNSGFKVSYDYNTKTGSSFTISKAGVGTYGVVKAYQVSTISANTLKAYNGKNYPVSMTANGYAYVAVPWTDTNDNTISYVTHKGNGTGNFINGIIVTKSGTNPVSYTVTYSYGTALTSALSTYKDIYSIDFDDAWDSSKQKVKIAEGKVVSYTNGSTETIAAYTGADIYVNVLSSTAYGVAKAYHNAIVNTTINAVTTDAGRYYGIQKNAEGKLVVNVPWASTSTTGFITGADVAYKNIWAVDTNETWDSTKKKVKIAEGRIISYTNKVENIAAYTGADLYVSVMTDSSYGIAKAKGGNSGTNFVGITDGFLTYTDTDTKVTSADNHYSPSGTNQTVTSTSVGNAGKNSNIVTEISYSRDNKGHITTFSYKVASLSQFALSSEVPSGDNFVTKAQLSAQGYVSAPMSYTTYGYAKLGTNSAVTINPANKVYPIAIETATGRLGVAVPWNQGINDNTYTYLIPGTAIGSGNVVNGLVITQTGTHPSISYTLSASYTLASLSLGGEYHNPSTYYVCGATLTNNGLSYVLSFSYRSLPGAEGGGDDPTQWINEYDASDATFHIATRVDNGFTKYMYIPTMNAGSYGVASLFNVAYSENAQIVSIPSTDYQDSTRNYGISIDKSGRLFAHIPWTSGNVSLTQSGANGTVVSSIYQDNNNNFVVTYTTVATSEALDILTSSISNLANRYDNITGYIENGNGRAIHWDTSSPYPHAYVDLTGFNVGGNTSNINSMAFANNNAGSQLTINDGTAHTAILPVMSNVSYGVAQANLVEWTQEEHEFAESTYLNIQTIDPTSNYDSFKNYKVNIAKYTNYTKSGGTDNPAYTGYLFVSIPTADLGSGSGSGGATITYFGGRQVTSGTNNAYYLAIKENTTYFVSYIPRASSSTYGMIKVNATSAGSQNPSVSSSGNYYPIQTNNAGAAVVRVPSSGSGGNGTDPNAVHYVANGTGVSGLGPIYNIQVVTSPSTDPNTLYIVI